MHHYKEHLLGDGGCQHNFASIHIAQLPNADETDALASTLFDCVHIV